MAAPYACRNELRQEASFNFATTSCLTAQPSAPVSKICSGGTFHFQPVCLVIVYSRCLKCGGHPYGTVDINSTTSAKA
eukprot:130503-Prorocentrum_minimum.AAC.3